MGGVNRRQEDCPHKTCLASESRIICGIASKIAGVSAASNLSACRFCTAHESHWQINEVTVSMAIGAVKHDPAVVSAIMDGYGYLIRKVSDVGNAKRLQRIQSGSGVGSFLWRMLSSLGVSHKPNCSCLSLAEEMNRLGPDGCRRECDRLAAEMKRNAGNYGWGDVLRAVANAMKAAIHDRQSWVWRLSAGDLYGSLIDEAVRQSEAAATTTPVSQTPLSPLPSGSRYPRLQSHP